MTRPVRPNFNQRIDANRDRQRIRNLERRIPAGDWVYVGTYPDDLRTTPDSPPFQTPWTNSGDGSKGEDELTKFRWKIGLGASLEIWVNAEGGDLGTLIFTLPADYWPALGKQTIDATDNSGNFTCYTVIPRDDGSNQADVYAGRL